MLSKVLSFGRLAPALLFVVVLTVVLSGCFGDFAPTAPSNDDVKVDRQRSEEVVYFGFSPQTLKRAAKLLDGHGASVSKLVTPAGDNLGVGFNKINANLDVPKRAVNKPVEISMALYGSGYRLDDVVVAFAPAGLVFNRAATLYLKLNEDIAKSGITESVKVYHYYSDGTIVEARILAIVVTDGNVEIWVEIPGFSRYGLAD